MNVSVVSLYLLCWTCRCCCAVSHFFNFGIAVDVVHRASPLYVVAGVVVAAVVVDVVIVAVFVVLSSSLLLLYVI